MKHLRKFDSVADLDAAIANTTIGILGLAYEGGNAVIQNKKTPPDPTIPFYIDVRGPVTLAETTGLQMSTDKTNWTDTTATTLPSGKTYFRVATDQSSPLKPNWTEGDGSDYDIGGNINSLVKTSFEEDTTCYVFYDGSGDTGFFQDKAKLKRAGNLILPATTLVNNCYKRMFRNCTSLTAAPELPATTLAEGCYQQLFQNSPNINNIKCLATDISATNCTTNWTDGVAANGTFVKNPNMSASTWGTGANGIPEGWTVQDAQD
jgi:hypothetical protein